MCIRDREDTVAFDFLKLKLKKTRPALVLGMYVGFYVVGPVGCNLLKRTTDSTSLNELFSKQTIISSSSSRGKTPSALHSYSKRRFIRPPVSPTLRQWEAGFLFLR